MEGGANQDESGVLSQVPSGTWGTRFY